MRKWDIVWIVQETRIDPVHLLPPQISITRSFSGLFLK